MKLVLSSEIHTSGLRDISEYCWVLGRVLVIEQVPSQKRGLVVEVGELVESRVVSLSD